MEWAKDWDRLRHRIRLLAVSAISPGSFLLRDLPLKDPDLCTPSVSLISFLVKELSNLELQNYCWSVFVHFSWAHCLISSGVDLYSENRKTFDLAIEAVQEWCHRTILSRFPEQFWRMPPHWFIFFFAISRFCRSASRFQKLCGSDGISRSDADHRPGFSEDPRHFMRPGSAIFAIVTVCYD